MNLKLLLLSSLILSGCSLFNEEPEISTRVEYVKQEIPLVEHPVPVNMYDISFYVVTPENLDEFKGKFEKENGILVFYAISVPDYEKLSINMAELKRYLEQQKEIIVYYENQLNSEE